MSGSTVAPLDPMPRGELSRKSSPGQHGNKLMPITDAALEQHYRDLRVLLCFKRGDFLTSDFTYFDQSILQKCKIFGSEWRLQLLSNFMNHLENPRKKYARSRSREYLFIFLYLRTVL